MVRTVSIVAIILSVIAAICSVVVPAVAQQTGSVHVPEQPPQPPSTLIWTKQIEGGQVRTPAGDDLGKIDGVLLDSAHNSVVYVMVDVGGFLGIGNRLVALPWAALRPSPDHKTYVANVTKDVLKAAPSADSATTATIGDPNWQQAVDAYWSQRAGLVPETAPPPVNQR